MPRRLLNKSFVLLWQGQTISELGNRAFLIAVMYWTMKTTGSASLMGLVMVTSALPQVLLGPLGGFVADRVPRRSIIVACDLLAGIAVLSLAALFFFVPTASTLIVAWVLVVTAVVGGLQSFFQPAIQAAIPDLVPAERLAAANSLHAFSQRVSMLVGYAVGGVLFAICGTPLLLLIDGLSYLFSAASELFITLPELTREPAARDGWLASFRRDTVEAFRYIGTRRGMRKLILTITGINCLLAPVLVLMPVYVDRHLGANASAYGFMLAAMSAGAIAGYSLAAGRFWARQRAPLMILSLFLFAGLFALLAVADSTVGAVLVMLAAGVPLGAINISLRGLLQIGTPPKLRGRVIGLVTTLMGAVMPLGLAAGGILGDLAGQNVAVVYAGCSLCGVVFVMLTALNREVWGYLSTTGEYNDSEAGSPSTGAFRASASSDITPRPV